MTNPPAAATANKVIAVHKNVWIFMIVFSVHRRECVTYSDDVPACPEVPVARELLDRINKMDRM
jgi:hypothetical protein